MARFLERAPFDDPESRAARGPNGRRLCRWCGVEVGKGRQTWCSQACVDQFLVRRSAAGARRFILERDGGRCAGCGMECERIHGLLRRLEYGLRFGWRDTRARRRVVERWATAGRRLRALLVESGYDVGRSLWDADHIVPVVLGGGPEPENLRTLCQVCHKVETAKLARERARARRGMIDPGSLLRRKR